MFAIRAEREYVIEEDFMKVLIGFCLRFGLSLCLICCAGCAQVGRCQAVRDKARL